MGCASSAPLVQQGLDAARKAVSRDAVEEKTKSMAKDAIESDQAKGILESVNNAKDEAVEKMEEFGETVKEKVEHVVEEIEEKVESLVGSSKEKAEEVNEDLKDAVESFDEIANEEAPTEPATTPEPDTTPDKNKEGDLIGSPATTAAATTTTVDNSYETAHTPEIWTRTETISPSGSSELREIKQEIEQDLLALGATDELDQEEEDLEASKETKEEETLEIGQTSPAIGSSDVDELEANVEIKVEEYPSNSPVIEENPSVDESLVPKDENLVEVEGTGEEEIIEVTVETLEEKEEFHQNEQEEEDNVIINEEASLLNEETDTMDQIENTQHEEAEVNEEISPDLPDDEAYIHLDEDESNGNNEENIDTTNNEDEENLNNSSDEKVLEKVSPDEDQRIILEGA
ncbi:uncharacterized protein isoform X1 [Rhodnius prolixus]|uniref:uncharacterized protein isoform X1 n=1 Tax=Rhodnius prolixus TaxID=13249 RepID=UPI003D18EFAD